jgi:hypothetical protein
VVRKLEIFAAFFVLSALTSSVASSAPATRHLVYQFGYNTPIAASGNGTGTTTIDITPAADGGVTISGTDHWWNTVRARATNTCELHPNGDVKCSQAPYSISPMQLTIFPLLAHDFFKHLNPGGTSSWSHTFQFYGAIIPGASGFAGQPYTWKCSYQYQGKGPIKNAGSLIMVDSEGTLNQQGGTYLKAKSKQQIVYDPVAKVVGIVSDVRTHIPMRSVYSSDTIQLKLTKDSAAHHG